MSRAIHPNTAFCDRYGPWALVAGASEGLGEAFALALASRGMNLVLLARRAAMLEAVAQRCRAEHRVTVRCLAVDLGAPGLFEQLTPVARELEIGTVVYNAAYAPLGMFAEADPADLLHAVSVNVAGPVALLRTLVPAMRERQRGGIVLMSSLAGNQGAPRLATYAATKAFNTVLAESLWHELGDHGVDVLACCAGAIRTPGYTQSARKSAPGTLDAPQVAEAALAALGRGPKVVPGRFNAIAGWVMGRLLPRRTAIRIMAKSTANLALPERRDS